MEELVPMSPPENPRVGPSLTTQNFPLSRKRTRALLDDESLNSEESNGGVPLNSGNGSNEFLSINQDFARRFEHNKKREELQQLQERHGKTSIRPSYQTGGDDAPSDLDDSTDTSTNSEDEDNEGILASETLERQIQTTLEAIRSKDPRVYDTEVKFFTDPNEEGIIQDTVAANKEKPIYLSDYHRETLLSGDVDFNEEEHHPPTYAEQQNDLKSTIIKEIDAAARGNNKNIIECKNGEVPVAGTEDGDFLIQKKQPMKKDEMQDRKENEVTSLDVENADKDPETYLTKFMSSRAWVPSLDSRFQPFESDDDEDEERAEQYEQAYNFRFEDPQLSNEKLVSHARDATARYSVRRDAGNNRKKARVAEREKKEAERIAKNEEKARLRKLKIADAEEKLAKIKEAAGLRGKTLQVQEWSSFLDENWDGERWEEEMRRRFDDEYYADYEVKHNDQGLKDTRKAKKPKWKEDIEINDLIPDFEAGDDSLKVQFDLTNSESRNGITVDTDERGHKMAAKQIGSENHPYGKGTEHHEKHAQLKQARQERRQVERLVDQKLDVDERLRDVGRKHSSFFRYRDTSPLTFGLTAQDILMASDSQLNQYAGLKKMATFRDPEKKRQDMKRLGKKARLRNWRKDTFGDEHGLGGTLGVVVASQRPKDSTLNGAGVAADSNAKGKQKRRRSKKNAYTEN